MISCTTLETLGFVSLRVLFPILVASSATILACSTPRVDLGGSGGTSESSVGDSDLIEADDRSEFPSSEDDEGETGGGFFEGEVSTDESGEIESNEASVEEEGQGESGIQEGDDIPDSLSNNVPVAQAGVDMIVEVGQWAVLNGGGSTDDDGDILSYQWTLEEKPVSSSAALVNDDQIEATILLDVEGTYRFELSVFDGEDWSDGDSVEIEAIVRMIEVLSLNGGENIAGGDQVALTWNSQHTSGTVNILCSNDNFVSDLHLIAQAIEDDGSHSWMVPNIPSETLRLRVEDASIAGLYDDSDQDWSLVVGGISGDIPGWTELQGIFTNVGFSEQESSFADFDDHIFPGNHFTLTTIFLYLFYQQLFYLS